MIRAWLIIFPLYFSIDIRLCEQKECLINEYCEIIYNKLIEKINKICMEYHHTKMSIFLLFIFWIIFRCKFLVILIKYSIFFIFFFLGFYRLLKLSFLSVNLVKRERYWWDNKICNITYSCLYSSGCSASALLN